MKKEKHGFSSRIGFILAAAGSAVGLGNIWRFPYLAARHGGGIFLLVYLILAVTFGFSLLVTEIALGRKTGKSSVKAFSALNRKWGFAGYLEAAVPIIIFPYYCVIGGWVTKYLTVYAANDAHLAASDEYFSGFISKTGQPIIFLLIFIGLTSAVVFMGVQKGIEKISKILMPILILISIGIAVYALTLDGATDGLLFYIKPDFSKFSIKTVIAAMGQLFYSMSLAMGIMITYGSYMRKEDNLEKSVRHIEIFDTAIAFISGLMIIPAVFIFSHGDESKLNAGPSLMFETLPKVFDSMYGGKIIGFVFFVLVLFAALTSAISLMETIVSIFSDKLKCSRRVICFWVMIVSSLMAIPSSLGYGMWSGVKLFGFAILDFFDFLSNNILMPIVALLTCIFVGYIIKTKTIEDEVEISGEFKSKKLYRIMIKYVAPIFVITILISSVFGFV